MNPPVESRARTGIDFIDEHLQGGFSRPCSILLFSELPSERRTFAERFAVEGARAGETCLYVDFFRAPGLARREFERHGPFPLDRVLFVDAISAQLLLPSDEAYQIRNIQDLTHIEQVIEAAIKDCVPSRIIVDSMEFLADRFPKQHMLDIWQRLVDAATNAKSVICFLFLNWTYGDREVQEIRAMTDFVLEFRTSMEEVGLRNRVRVIQNRDTKVETNWIPYAYKDIAGTAEVLPRILVTGPTGAGKTSVVERLSGKTLRVEQEGTSITFDYRRIYVMGVEPSEPGAWKAFSSGFTFKIFAEEADGILLVVDASRPAQLRNAKAILELVPGHMPCVVLLNKSDLPQALSAKEVASRLGIGPDIPIVPTVAIEGRGVLDALMMLGAKIAGVG